MLKKFNWCKFGQCNLEDTFFDSLKEDYHEFPQWFQKKVASGENAFVFKDSDKIKAFVYLKEEDEEIPLCAYKLPKEKRLKIGTLKLSDDIQGQRLGEGAIGISLWHWQNLKVDQVYITVFNKHSKLINILEQFGFEYIGNNMRGERVYLKDKSKLKYDTPYMSFPFINPAINRCGYIPINDEFHDTLFPIRNCPTRSRKPKKLQQPTG